VRPRALHLTEAQQLAKEAPVDIAFICTNPTTRLGGADDPAVSGAGRLCRVIAELHERGDDRRDRRLGQGAGLHRQQYQRRAHRAGPCPSRRQGRIAAHTVYRVGEVHGRITERAQEVLRLVSQCRQRQGTDNLWGERWSKLVTNSMANGCLGCTGLSGAQMAQNERDPALPGAARQRGDPHRPGARLQARRGQPPAAGGHRAGRRGRPEALGRYEDRLAGQRRGSAEQRPSMGQDMAKGRRTEIEFLNGFVVREGERSDCRRAPTSGSSRSSKRSSAANSSRTRATSPICG
jgi:2-dehydropantoate 2-reductase